MAALAYELCSRRRTRPEDGADAGEEGLALLLDGGGRRALGADGLQRELAAGDHRGERLRHLGVAGEDAREGLAVDAQERRVGRGHHGGGAGLAGEQRHLAEERAPGEARYL